MSKRKNRKQRAPNLPQDVLARARQQATEDLDDEDSLEDEEVVAAAPPPKAKEAPAAAPSAPPSRRRPEVRAERRDRRRDPNKPLTANEVADMLEHPTKTVSIEELSQQYNYVLNDLRSMGILAAALIVLLVFLAQVL